MRYNKLKGFTLAEVMVLLLTLSILLAAFSPVFTTRYNSYSNDVIWQFVPSDDENDAYYDTPNKNFTATAFIGLTPGSPAEVTTYSLNAANQKAYSKLIIRASDRIRVGGIQKPQAQMHFRYGGSIIARGGDQVGALFAGKSNFLLGGGYTAITNSAFANTAYGRLTLNALTSGAGNTAVGTMSQDQVKTATYNTTVGSGAGNTIADGKTGNTAVGAFAGLSIRGNYNTLFGYSAGKTTTGTGNTLIGNWSGHNGNAVANTVSGSYNTSFGNYSSHNLSSGSYNTAVGYNALSGITTGSYNTAVGYSACENVTTGYYKTCIGAYSGASKNESGNDISSYSNLFTGTQERIFIGSYPRDYINPNSSKKPAAVLEVHNIDGTNSNSLPISGVGNTSVVINGNLIVRGQTYLETPIIRPRQKSQPAGLIGFKLNSLNGTGVTAFSGDDGFKRTERSCERCRGCKSHGYNDVRKSCICTSSNTNSYITSDGRDMVAHRYKGDTAVSQSYDWSSPSYGEVRDHCDCNGAGGNRAGMYYNDTSINQTFRLSYTSNQGNKSGGEVETPCSHTYGDRDCVTSWSFAGVRGSCCPVIKSDKRLKNVGDKFSAGLDELKKLKIYNFTFKSDPDKTPHVGVIAQDLKTVFPNAVKKDESGYLQIRWDEMFYALINSVKNINERVQRLASGISNDKNRIIELKKDNAALNAQLDKLVNEVTELEAKKN